MIVFLLGAALTALGLHTLGSGMTAESTPYGLEPLVGLLWTCMGAFMLWRGTRSAIRAGSSLVLPATGAGIVCVLSLTAGLLGLPVDALEVGPECLTSSGNLVDCDDARIDTDAERATARPPGGPPPPPEPAATPVG